MTATDVPGEAEIWSNVTSGGPSRVSESLRHVYDTEHPKISFAGEKNDSVEGLKNVLTAMEAVCNRIWSDRRHARWLSPLLVFGLRYNYS